jgi:hypothetical protein
MFLSTTKNVKNLYLAVILYLGYHGNGSHFEKKINTPKSCHTLRWIFLQSFMKFDERNPIFFKSSLFCFHGYCGKVCPTDSDLFNLSCSTRCGWCSYQVSSISVQRVTCYNHFCVFQFFSILAVSMATAAILKIPEVVCTSTHSA